MASAGMLRRDSVLFIDATIRDKILEIFENNRDTSVPLVPSKYSAYFSLYSSSSYEVTFPRIAVVPDKIIKAAKRVNYGKYIAEGVDPLVVEKEMELEFNAFDGQGLCSPEIAEVWKKELELDYLPSYFGVRAPFIKGQCTVFDFHKFGKEIANSSFITDIYGKTISIQDVDCIISESQFKLWNAYTSTEFYVQSCKDNNLGWGITKVPPKRDKNHARTSYQFLQVLNLSDDAIKRLCKPTLDWINESGGAEIMSTLMYSLGETDFTEGWFERADVITQALLLNNSLLNDGYVRSHYSSSLSKKMNDAKMGRLYLEGNYQCMISDPYAQCSHIFGIEFSPLLQEGQHYSQYWNERGVDRVAAIRSPIVHHGEVGVLNLQSNPQVTDWYRYIYSGIVYPANGVGIDTMIHGGADFDLDIVCTVNSPEIISGIIPDLPVVYDVVKPEKVEIPTSHSKIVYESQLSQIKTNKIGFYTNVSSSLYAMLADYPEGSHEREIILNRLRWGRVLQGTEIDKAKGVKVDPYPEHFTKYKRISEEMDEEEKTQSALNNSLIAEKRPVFMRWLYADYNARYRNERQTYDTISRTRWGKPFEEIERLSETEEQVRLVERYKRKTFFIDNDSTMNRISRYIENSLRNFKSEFSKNISSFDYTALLSGKNVSPNIETLNKLKVLYKEYKSLRKTLYRNGSSEISFEDNQEICKYINQKAYRTISSNGAELADMTILLCYTIMGKNSKSFLWNVFGKEVLENLKGRHSEKYVRVPMYNDKGSSRYLWSNYGIYKIQIKE